MFRRLRYFFLLLLLLLNACTTFSLKSLLSGQPIAESEIEKVGSDGKLATPDDPYLDKVENLREGVATVINGNTLVAGAFYHAASGKRCRTVMFTKADGGSYCRLACQTKGQWAWARTF